MTKEDEEITEEVWYKKIIRVLEAFSIFFFKSTYVRKEKNKGPHACIAFIFLGGSPVGNLLLGFSLFFT